MGAPESDPRPQGQTQTDAGTVYLADAKDLDDGGVDVDGIGVTIPGIQLIGTQEGEALGYAIAAGGDNRADGSKDLLIGAPLYDADLRTDAGRVIQTSQVLTTGVYEASEIGATVGGMQWTGAAVGDQLGEAVAGVGT